ncbi:maleylpyruvate isomerase N-terminal domain-containing protein [Arthrobacter sp. UYEF3]|uniref:maleylpyruvate isomerase N-terminal domain-containing protein n=1 Tax=Arthrobacter sp. UYEF3 TaxID=1756365 RepID=UPI003398E9AA
MDGAQDSETIRTCYLGAARAFLELVEQVPEAAWAKPALGVWDVRGLTGHASRALSTVETYLAMPATGESVAGPAAYFLAVRSSMAPDMIARRGRETGDALGAEPATAVKDLVQRVTTLLRDTPDDAAVATPAGAMNLIGYLPTRTFELAVHSLDLARALTLPSPAALGPAVAASLELAAAVGAHLPAAGDLLLLLTGRSGLPRNLSVL